MISLIPSVRSILHRPPISISQINSSSQFHSSSIKCAKSLVAKSKQRGGTTSKKKNRGSSEPWDYRITLIRQHLFFPKVPRVLRLGRNRYMRHWTIDTAWKLFTQKKKDQHQLELQRQWESMRRACEQLRILGDDGVEGGENTGRRFRECMNKGGVWDELPIEYARCQTDWPSTNGWNHDWKRS